MSKKVYGIDLGTTYSALSTLDDREMPMIIGNQADGIPLFVSAVYFPEDDGDPVVGIEAKNQAEIEPERVVQCIKREIGKPITPERAKALTFNGKEYNPVEISALILKRIKEHAFEQGHDVGQVVITCPAYFGNEEREATKQAGRIAGLDVLSIINEPTAAALNYCSREFAENRKIMVYDLGGGTFDVTLVDFSVGDDGKEATVNVIETGGDDRLGGIDWDKRLEEYLVEHYCDENGLSQADMQEDAGLVQNIRSKVEEAKKKLSSLTTTKPTINYGGNPTRIEVKREQFEEITRDLVDRTMVFVRQTLEKAQISADDVNVVLLVGGSTRMPMIQDAVKKMFPGEGRVIVDDPDLAVAKGAALAAHMKVIENIKEKQSRGEDLSQEEEEVCNDHLSLNMKIKDKLSRSFGPAVLDDNEQLIIDNLVFVGDDAPAEKKKIYPTAAHGQKVVTVRVFENVSKDEFVTPSMDKYGKEQYTDPTLKVKYLGSLRLECPPNTPINTQMEVFFRVSSVGVEVHVRNMETNEMVKTNLSSENIFTEEEVEQKSLTFSEIKTSGNI